MAASCAGHVAPPAPVLTVDGRCGAEPGVCRLGVPAPSAEPGDAFGWRCLGVNGGETAACSVAPAPRAVEAPRSVERREPRGVPRPASRRPAPAASGSAVGLWSDGDTAWVTDSVPFASGTRPYPAEVAHATIGTIATVEAAARTVSIAQEDADAVAPGHQIDLTSNAVNEIAVNAPGGASGAYTVDIPKAPPAPLAALYVDGVDISVDDRFAPRFAPGVFDYDVEVGHDVAAATVSAAPFAPGGAVAITPADADSNASGHQVELTAGATGTVVLVVTHDGGSSTYTARIHRPTAGDASVSTALTATDDTTEESDETVTVSTVHGGAAVDAATVRIAANDELAARAAEGRIPNQSYPSNELFTRISPNLGDRHHNQPTAINGYLLLAGNGVHEFWDISNPYSPRLVSELFSPHRFGEAESHQVSYARFPNGNLHLVTISGRGIDLWDIDNVHQPQLLSALELPNINYGDVHNSVWGVAWQGEYIYVGASTRGLYVVDAGDPTRPQLVAAIPTGRLGGIPAGPLFALGNLLVITTPKDHAGLVTMDVSDPANPTLLDFVQPRDASYIGWFYGKNAHLLSPFRTYDVTTDPRNIQLIGSVTTPTSEYMSFGDGHLFLGGMRGGSQGIWKYDISDPNDLGLIGRIPGRDSRWDDQFSVPIGNLIAISDDQYVDGYVGSYLAVHATEPDTRPPVVDYVNPPDGAVDQAITSRIALSFSDQIEFTSVDSSTLIVRPVGGQALTGKWGYTQTVVTFWPDQPLQADTSYEVVAVAGGITDLVGNALANEFRSEFRTGAPSPRMFGSVAVPTAVETGQNADFVVKAARNREYLWDFGDGRQAGGASVSYSYDTPGRYTVTLSVVGPDGSDVFEAETASLSGGVVAASDRPGYSGNGYADYPFEVGSNVKVQWRIERNSAGDADIDVRYANGGTVNRPLDLVVNRNTVKRVAFESTGSWGKWQTVTIADVALDAGSNTLELIARSRIGPNVDRLSLPSETSTVLARYTATQIVHRPLPANEPARSSTVIVAADQARAWTVNPDADTVTAVDTAALSKALESNVGLTPRTLAQAPDGTIWVVNEGSYDISVLDSDSGAVIDTIDLPYASMPYGIAFAPDGSAAYVTLQALGRLLRIDPATRTVVHSLALGPDASGIVPKPRGIAIDSDSARILVTRFVSPEQGGEIYDVDVRDQTMRLTRTIDLAIDPGPDTPDSGRGIPNYISSLAISPDGTHARVPSKKDNIERGVIRDGQALTHDNAVRTVISQIDLMASGHEDLAARIDLDDHDMAFALAFSPLGDLMFAAIQGSNVVDVIDAYDGTHVAGISTGLAPQGLTLDHQGRLYVQNFMSRSLSVFDVAALLTGTASSAELLAEIELVANETLSDEVLLGKQIFYDASSSEMSLEGYISCASCHLDGAQDGRAWDFTDRGEGLRNTISLQGRGGTLLQGPVHWTGNFDEIQDFENDIRSHFGGSGFMSDDDFNSGTRSDPLGDPKAGLSTDLDALAAYVSSLTSVPLSPYRNADGSLTDEGELGKQVFAREGCGNCHGGAEFTDSALGVVHDVGTITSDSGGRLGQSLAGFDTPTLKGVWATAPYLHDGSASTLALAIEAHGGVSLADSALSALVSYLEQIDGLGGGGRPVPNEGPVATGTLADRELRVSAGSATVDVAGAFSDPDNDALTFTAVSSAPAVATVSVSGSEVRVTPVSSGTAVVTVTARDAGGSNTTATQTFSVSVDGGPGGSGGSGGSGGGRRNRGRETVGTLEDRMLEVGEAVSVDLGSAFRDRDADVLTYAAESSVAEVASVSASGSVVAVTALSAGESVVKVTATDAAGSNRSAEHRFTVTVAYDPDGDGLIGVHTLAQLDALRHDLDGDGTPTAAGAAGYAAAFGVMGTGTVSCAAAGGCRGYELGSDLDFDTNGSGSADAGDAYWYGGAGWLPLGTASEPFLATFDGNGHRIRGLFVRRGDGAGLFGAAGSSGVVRHVGVIAVDVAGSNGAGALVGMNAGTVTGGYATGRVSGAEAVGGLVGSSSGVIGGSHAAVQVAGGTSAGGLIGVNTGRVVAGYATGRVSGTHRVGGLVGYNRGALTTSYATGPVSEVAEAGGLVGTTEPPGTVTDSYWDTDTSGRPMQVAGDPGGAGQGRSTSDLQAPTDYAGLYAAWNVDVDGDGVMDAPWHFGTDAQYPALSLDVDGDGRASWEETGGQLRAGPELTAVPFASPAQVVLRWTVAAPGALPSSLPVTFTVYRATGDAMETVAANVRGLGYSDRGVEPVGAYTYQVAAVVDGGEAARSALVPATVGTSTPCAYTVTPLHREVLWTAGTGEVTVTTGSSCAWTAASASESAFLTLTAGAAGTGSGTVSYAVAPNGGGPRRGVLTVAGQRATVFQASPTIFADHPIERGVTPVKAIHFVELRARVDALRTGARLPAFAWTDPTLTPGVTPIRRVHLTELGAALAEAYAAAGRPPPAFMDMAVTGTMVIKTAHLMELRAAVLVLEASRQPT